MAYPMTCETTFSEFLSDFLQKEKVQDFLGKEKLSLVPYCMQGYIKENLDLDQPVFEVLQKIDGTPHTIELHVE